MTSRYRQLFILLCFALAALPLSGARAASAQEIDIEADAAIKRFYQEVGGGRRFVQTAKAVLIFPKVLKAGLLIGGEYGEGALRITGKTVDYYSTTAASFGFQAGVQSKSILIAFMSAEALKSFRASAGFEVGVTGSVAVVEYGAGGEIDSHNISDPIVGFVFGNKGLMIDASLEGSKYTRLNK